MISVLCPTRERPQHVNTLIHTASINAVTRPEFVFYIDDDDVVSRSTLATYVIGGMSNVRYAIGPRIKMSDMWNRCAEAATRKILMFTDDEAIFHTPNWDEMIEQEFARQSDGALLVQPNDLVHDGANAGYFFVHRVWLEIFGRLTPPHFSYGYADIWPMEVAAACGRKRYRPDIIIENTAPKNQPPDHVHQANAARYAADRCGDVYHATQAEREAEVVKLQRYILEGRTVA